ncbi:MAG: sodium:calcium symporter [Ignavibacteria bacterium GWA2_55_11]|nr:MAG: sodium:calcium symporter [Ignavibacteria bacterium GWA2_55_11]OGU44515.1 MAG: sodium:calcium symporter [Ignavibacteria bacterium GWC2_56_12]OGU62018.1 MAG: sodium:calcium symporter [Ignavibacteria bacterium RIFCSPHIGHO2_02_FULL_56_12]OGU71827.1 MAG: sodium:calcium symporter [Ignavibacteria bacterium RIFCSPLOWO2_02_FULL_55_14]OGU76980.1 MAG: sodium:calcium symporter [Ignavibacteria bacterium RIFCSPLOWO2_12_FULL_56_21]
MAEHKERWGSRVGLVLAMAGNAVGLGNFLRFPAQAVQNGGGAFIIPYLVSFLLMGIPLLWIEWAIGRHGGKYGHHSAPGMMDVIGKGNWWKYIGVFGIFTNLTVAAYYTYLESWTLAYVWHSITGAFSGMTSIEVANFFLEYVDAADGSWFNFPSSALFWFGITLALNLWILSRGLSKGVEIASKIGMPLLIMFGIFLAIRTLTLDAGEQGAVNDALVGLNFLWEPQFDSLTNPSVWMAAAGQIFFTLSVGMGSIHCYAAYVQENDDIALNAASAGWMNEFVEVILGGSIVVPIATAYLGLDWVQDNVGLAMGFRTMPTLFQNWGPFLAGVAGVAWFGLLFFAGITSSLAMGQPVMAFMQDEYKLSRGQSARMFGLFMLILSLWTVFFYGYGAFGEFDDWSGTFALVVFALFEAIAFAWVFGMEKGWAEITRGADIEVPYVFKYVIKYVTPLFLLVVFVGALIAPAGGDWSGALSGLFAGEGWNFSAGSIVGKLWHVGYADKRWFVDGSPTPVFIVDATRSLLLLVFVVIALAVRHAWKRNQHTY